MCKPPTAEPVERRRSTDRGDAADAPDRRPTIGDIFREYGPAYRAQFAKRMSRDQLRAMAMIERCRTGALGGAVYRCAQCQRLHSVPRSCGNRHCPNCQGDKTRQWLDGQLAKLLPCAYFMITFTVPKELRRFVRSHPKECYKALFDASSATLAKLASTPKFVGSSDIGVTGVLHTWGRSLVYHPHVHYIVPGGAIGPDGQSWLSSRVDFFVPVRAASPIFRAKFRDAMRECGLLDQIPPEVWRKAWVVNSQAVGDGRAALKYLAKYVFRIACGNSRIVKVELGLTRDGVGSHFAVSDPRSGKTQPRNDFRPQACKVEPGPKGKGRVTFTYKKSGSRKYRPMTVKAKEFIRRYLQHVLPRGFQKVRHYGFAHPRRKIDREWLAMLVTLTLNMVYVLNVGASKLAPSKFVFACPACGGELKCVGFIPADCSIAAIVYAAKPIDSS